LNIEFFKDISPLLINSVEAKALMAVTKKSIVFWVVMPCNSERMTFQWNILLPSSGSKSKQSKKSANQVAS
jgi:hypothetical protein